MKLAVIFPARNEGKTIARCIEMVRQSKHQPDVLVVDGHSADNTRQQADDAGAMVIPQSKNIYPAKGTGMRDGVRAALKRGAEVIAFLDADIVSLTGEWVDLLADPVVEGGCDMSRGYYRRADYDGAVTKLVAKPLTGTFFPEVAYLNQPLSGEICATAGLFADLLKSRDWPDGWGVDIWLLIETAMRDYRIQEVFLGTKVHTSRDEYAIDVIKLAKMAEQVSLTIFREAIKHKRVDNVKHLQL
jgi:glucosyl-3-phosphoglycerate synthase